ncbi:lipid droplet-associated hydrolase [Echria macrotheca]|uniref:Lipid droplet-associated hydrolase n=1 Tax=Echria macrotheca TaxID=438768 RepID=A0AAJ0BFJ8_9PEZI|nr:lipid droplet-associated hydrolase [Echria macrotheca]
MTRIPEGMLSLGRRVQRVPSIELASQRRLDKSRQTCLVFFVPGNPGLINYYEPFLSTLRLLLDEVEARPGCDKSFHIYGQNLIGFDDADHEVPFGRAQPPFNLEDQIVYAYESLMKKSRTTLESGDSVAFDKVIIMGHSVGAYISIEVFHRHHHHLKAVSEAKLQGDSVAATDAITANLTGGIMLFPAVSHLAKSDSGQKLDVIRRNYILDNYAHHVARSFVGLWPSPLLRRIVRWFTGFPDHATEVTTRFLQSQDGIWQALHMGKDELRQITEEKWSEDLWEIAEDKQGLEADKFFFYFAKKDHWVADECRDAFIERRREQIKGRTKILIDEDSIPHAFCIHHSEQVAEKVLGWIQHIVGCNV